MSTLWKFTAREIRSRPGRAVLTLLSVVIGVAMVVAIAVATTSTRRAFKAMSEALTGRAGLEIVAEGVRSFEQSLVDEVAQVPGVSAAIPVVQRQTIIYVHPEQANEEAVAAEEAAKPPEAAKPEEAAAKVAAAKNAEAKKADKNKANVIVLGIDPAQDEKARDYELAEGKFFHDDGTGLLLEKSFAKAMDVKVGDLVKLRTARGGLIPPEFEVVGLLEPRGAAAFSQGGAVFLNIKEAQKHFSGPHQIDLVSIILDSGADPERVLSRIANAQVDRGGELQPLLPTGLTVRVPKTKTQSADEALLSTEQGLLVATFVSLVVAIFIVLNTFLINVAERRRQFAILRAIGATSGQVLRMLVAEGLAMGILGSMLGCGVGVLGAMLLTKATAGLTGAPLPPIQVTWFHLAMGCGIGVLVSFLATLVPAWLAGRVSPLEGLSRVSQQDLEGAPAWITTTGSFLLPVSLAILAACVAGWLPQPMAVPSAFLSIIGCVCLLPVTLEPLSRAVVTMLSPIMKIEGQLAQRQVLRRRTRATLTIGVLFVSLAGSIALGTTIINNQEDVRSWFRRTVKGDFFVRAMMPNLATGEAADMPEELGTQIAAIPGVTSVNMMRIVNRVTAAGMQINIFVRPYDAMDSLPLDLRSEDPEEIRHKLIGGEVVIGSVLAQRAGLTKGDQIVLDTKDGPQQFKIASVSNEYAVGGMVVHMDRQTAKKYFDISGATAFVVKADRHKLADVDKALAGLCKEYGLMLQSYEGFSRLVDGMMAGVVGCLWAVLVVGFVVAAFGIVNTLTMNVMEQTRELGLLRVVAMTRRQVRKTIISQAAIMGLVGIGPATVIGLALGYIINLSLLPVLGHAIEFQINYALLLGCFVISLAIVVAAAWMPAQRAARLQLAEALQYE